MKFGILAQASLVGYAFSSAIPKQAVPPLQGGLPEGYGHFATIIDNESGLTVEVLGEGFQGEPRLIRPVDMASLKGASVMPWQRRTFALSDTVTVSNSTGVSTVVRRNQVCASLATCVRQAAESSRAAAVYIAGATPTFCNNIATGIYIYFTDNNYANLNSIVQGYIVGITVNMVSSEIDAVRQNSAHGKRPNPATDKCGNDEREVLASDYASAIYQFCISIREARNDFQATRFYNGDYNDQTGQFTGELGATKAFIAAQAHNFGPVCRIHGVEWKRELDPEHTIFRPKLSERSSFEEVFGIE